MKNSLNFKSVKKIAWYVSLSLSALAIVNCTTEETIDSEESNATILEGTNSSFATPRDGRIYTIRNRKSGRHMNIKSASNSNGANLVQWGTNVTSSQTNRQFEVIDVGNGYVRIKGVDSGKSLEVKDGSNSNGANVEQRAYDNKTHQEWEILSTSNGYFRIKGRDSKKSMAVEDASTSNGANIEVSSWNGADRFQWFFTEVGESSDNGGDGGDDGDGDIDVPTGSNPWDFFENCNQWKITWVDGSEQKQLCSQKARSNQYFVSSDKKSLTFKVELKDGINSTKNSTYPRSELRERETDGSSDVYWTTSGNHALYIQQAITHLPLVKDHIVTGQIHGNKDEGIDDAMVVRLEGKRLFLSFNGGKLRSDVTITNNYNLGTKMEVILQIINGKHYCYYSTNGNLRSAYNSGNASQYLVNGGSLMTRSYGDAYFKVGNYTQSNEDTEGSSFGKSGNYGEVKVYAFNVNHKGGDL